MGYQLNLLTPKRMRTKETDTLVVQLAKIEEAWKEDKDMESENEAMRSKSAKKVKGKLTKGRVDFEMLDEKIEISGKKVEPLKFEEVRSNLFATHLSSWKVKYS